MDPNLLKAVKSAAAIKAPKSSLGASQGKELAALYQSSFQLPQATGAVSAAANIAQQQVAASKRAAAEAKQREQDLADPSKYRVVQKEDGGYDFFAPDGSQVDIATLTQRTGTKPEYWLKDSQNPIDIQYIQDKKNLEKFMNALITKDQKTIQDFTNNDEKLKSYTADQGGVHNLLQQFEQTYQRYYVPRSVSPQAWGVNPGAPVVPAAQSGSSYGVDTGSGGI